MRIANPPFPPGQIWWKIIRTTRTTSWLPTQHLPRRITSNLRQYILIHTKKRFSFCWFAGAETCLFAPQDFECVFDMWRVLKTKKPFNTISENNISSTENHAIEHRCFLLLTPSQRLFNAFGMEQMGNHLQNKTTSATTRYPRLVRAWPASQAGRLHGCPAGRQQAVQVTMQ